MLELCEEGPFEFTSVCVRTAWSALVPFAFVLITLIPFPSTRFLRPHLTLDEAEAFVCPDHSKPLGVKLSRPLCHGIVFVTIGLIETLAHFTHFATTLLISPTPESILSGAFALTWLYTALRPVMKPTLTVPYYLFVVYLMLFAGTMLQIAGILYDIGVLGDKWPSIGVWIMVIGNLIATATVLVKVLGMPMALPNEGPRSEDIDISVSPEDCATLFGRITFSWVYPLLQQGRYTTLNESDVWDLGPTLQSRPVYKKFMTLSPQMSFLSKIWAANSRELLLDFLLTIIGVALHYADPFFLKRILDIIDTSSSPESHAQAYIYALFAFLCALCKSQADAQHLRFSRRAATRIRSELMAAIYDKGLKKSCSRTSDREKETKEGTERGSASDSKADTDRRTIIDLMADANRISITISTVYAAPFEIVFASIFLYHLLGLAAFYGFFVLLLGRQLYSYVAKQNKRIHNGLLAARHKRMGVLSELIGAIKLVKTFAWEERWIKKVVERREREMAWMIKRQLNTTIYSLMMTSAPIVVSVAAFFVYVRQGNQLRVSTIFTGAEQTADTLNRIAIYLSEDEIDEPVSSSKREALEDPADQVVEEATLGIESEWFKWDDTRVEEGARGVFDDLEKKETLTTEEHGVQEQRNFDGEDGPREEDKNSEDEVKKLVKNERREFGRIKWAIYRDYLNASSFWICISLTLLVSLMQILGFLEKSWIMTWGEAYKDRPNDRLPARDSRRFSTIFAINWPHAIQDPMFYVAVYACIGLVTMLTSAALTVAQDTGARRASRVLFRNLLEAVVRATSRFHDTTPQGWLLNRFGPDIERIDDSLAGSLMAVNSSLADVIVGVILVAVVFPWFLVPAIFIGFAYHELVITYFATSRDLRRMQFNTRSPFSDLHELFEGIVTVWQAFALQVQRHLPPQASPVTFVIKSALTNTTVYWICRLWTALELDFHSVERVVEYLDLPQEPLAIIESNRPPADWPSSTSNNSLLVVQDLSIEYGPDLPNVLQNISFGLKAGERVGLLGQTDSDKWTLSLIIPLQMEPTSGRVVIDGIDISTIGIHDLRSPQTFISQDAPLFSGTLRENLDPFNEHTDAECFDVLRLCHMISSPPDSHSNSYMVSEKPTPAASTHNLEHQDSQPDFSTTADDVESEAIVYLDMQISAGGTNFSQGQRQLITMARALLCRSTIIILDEATNSVNLASDAKIQTTIRKEFISSLLLTIAHHPCSVIDYDRLIILDKGQIAELDTPWKLLRKENGIFRNMCLKSGTFSDLEAAAKSGAERVGKI
ncbi:hypothetical protein H0H92_011858 [Tricholoma furcatifolium]|nr:hypothetical protein H0H92_011858 [Tricholoma furcatifolium]